MKILHSRATRFEEFLVSPTGSIRWIDPVNLSRGTGFRTQRVSLCLCLTHTLTLRLFHYRCRLSLRRVSRELIKSPLGGVGSGLTRVPLKCYPGSISISEVFSQCGTYLSFPSGVLSFSSVDDPLIFSSSSPSLALFLASALNLTKCKCQTVSLSLSPSLMCVLAVPVIAASHLLAMITTRY